jgi:hypothetical protein
MRRSDTGNFACSAGIDADEHNMSVTSVARGRLELALEKIIDADAGLLALAREMAVEVSGELDRVAGTV